MFNIFQNLNFKRHSMFGSRVLGNTCRASAMVGVSLLVVILPSSTSFTQVSGGMGVHIPVTQYSQSSLHDVIQASSLSEIPIHL